MRETGAGPCPAFVGRTAELQQLLDALARTSGQTQLICIVGPAGIGKTTLTNHALASWQSDDQRVLWTRCWNGPGTPALRPWSQLLAALSDSGDITSSSTDRFTQFDSISEHLSQLSSTTPLTLVIDDLHWADHTTLELLHFIARDTRQTDLRIITTFRSPETEVGDAVDLINQIQREATVIEVFGLSRDEIGALAQLAGVESSNGSTDGPSDIVTALHDRTGGNPFFVAELLRLMTKQSTGEQMDVPISVRSVVESHLELVTAPTRQVLELAAVQGPEFDADTIAAAARLDTFELAEMLAEAERAHLISRTPPRWTFVHALIGETLLHGLTPHELATRHASTADGIQKLYGPESIDHVESIANHLSAAGTLVAPDRLVEAARAAAVEAGRRLAWESQATHLTQAIGALRSFGDPDVADIIDLLIQRCVAEKLIDNFSASRETALEASRLARERGDFVRLAEVALVFPPDTEGVELDQFHDPEQAKLREEALRSLPANFPALRSRLQAAHALSLYWESPVGDAEAHRQSSQRRDRLTADALATAEGLDDVTLAGAIKARIYANWGPATEDGRLELAERLVTVADQIGDVRMALDGRVWRISRLMATSRLVAAGIELDLFEADAVQIRDRFHQWTALRLRANLAFMNGNIDDSLRINQDAFEFGAAFLPNDAAMHFFIAALSPIHYVLGKMAESVEFAADMARQMPHVPAWRIGYALAAAEDGDLLTAQSELDAVAADNFAMVPRDLDFITAMMVASAVVRHTRDGVTAKAVADHLRPFAGKLVVQGIGYSSYGCFDFGLAQCADATGDTAEADRLYSAATSQLDATKSPYAMTSRLLHGSLLARIDPIRARRYLVEAIAGFEQMSAENMTRRARRALADCEQSQTVRLFETAEAWHLELPQRPAIQLAKIKGFRALQELLTHPNESRHALMLTSLIEGHGGVGLIAGTQLTSVDATTMRHYRKRIHELNSDLDAADQSGDALRSDELQVELDAVTAELNRVQGFGGRIASESSNADRARINVTKHLKRAVERIAAVDSDIGPGLRDAVSTGMYCSYAPHPDTTLIWSR